MKHNNKVLLLKLCDEEGILSVLDELCDIYASDIALTKLDPTITTENSDILKEGLLFIRNAFRTLKGVHTRGY